MNPDYNKLYAIPSEVIYPTSQNLRLDTDYANLNSEDYKLREPQKCDLPPFFDFIDCNSDGNIIIAANDVSISCADEKYSNNFRNIEF